MKEAITKASIFFALDHEKSFRVHLDASKLVVGGTLTQLDENGNDHVFYSYSKTLSPTKRDYTVNIRKLFGLISFLQRFRCSLEGSSFEIIPVNLVLKPLFTKPKLSRKEARSFETLDNFGIFATTLKQGKVQILDDTLSRALHVISSKDTNLHSFNDVEALCIDIDDILTIYVYDQFSGPIVKTLNGNWPSDKTEYAQLKRVIHMFRREQKRLLYGKKLYVPIKSVSEVLQLANDSNISGHCA